jgi:hypothetical protein
MSPSGAALATGLVLVGGGVLAAGWGIITASRRPRPFDLLGALVAPLGLVAALLGGVTLLVPGFLGW